MAHANDKELQEIDSVKNITKQFVDTIRIVDNQNKLAYMYGAINIDSSIHYSSLARYNAIKIDYQQGLGLSYLYTARASIEKGIIKDAITNFHEARLVYSDLKDSLQLLNCIRGMGYIYSFSSSQLKSLQFNLEALELAKTMKDTSSLATIYNNIGTIYRKLDDYENALFYLQKSINMDKSNSNLNPVDIAVSYSNIGLIKVDHGKVEEAHSDFQQLFRLLPTIESKYLNAYFFLSISAYYNAQNLYDSARVYLDNAKDLMSKNNIAPIKTNYFKRKGEYYINTKQYVKAIEAFDSCIVISEKTGVLNHLSDVYRKKSKALAALERFNEAYLASKEALNKRYSLKSQKVAGLLGEFEKEQKTKGELERLYLIQALKDQQNEYDKMQLNSKYLAVFSTAIILCLSIIIIIYFLLRVKKQNKTLISQHQLINKQKVLLEDSVKQLNLNEEKLHELIATKDKFFSIIAHDLRSPFTSIIGLSNELSLNFYDYSDTERIDKIKIIETTSESTYNLLENLLYWANSQRGAIKIKRKKHDLKQILNESISAYLGAAEMKNIKVENTICNNLQVYVDLFTIKTVFTNIFNNAIKFTHNGGSISISCSKNDHSAIICISDSGIGMTDEIKNKLFSIEANIQRKGTENEKGTGLGLILCKEFVKKNNGSISVESVADFGSKFCISLPLKK